MPTISVIVPAHNIEKYIVRCLDSLNRQTFMDFECIIVENASSDSTQEVIREYIKDKTQFKLISVKEAGVSNARNIGISASIADYITFIDGDDYVSENYLYVMVTGITEQKTDMVQLPYYYDTGAVIKCCKIPFPSGVYNVGNFINAFNYLYDFVGSACWGKLYRRDIVQNNDICFDTSLRYHEDFVFISQYIDYCKSMAFIDSGAAYYYYFLGRDDSACSSGVGSLPWTKQELQACCKIMTTCNNMGGASLRAVMHI